jgi:metallo-beta-lactamase family protein
LKITLFGAAGEVTGSCSLVETDAARVLIDFGQHQGTREAADQNRTLPPIEPARLNAVVLTHAHIDHVGRLPLLPGAGFKGPIYCSPATKDLATIMLRDAASLTEMEASRKTKRNLRRGKPPVAPLFTEDDAERAIALLRPMPMHAWTDVAPGVRVRPVDSGHILGSCSLLLAARDGGTERRAVFSGDVGPWGVPLLRDPENVSENGPGTPAPDVVFMESTYGDRDHRSFADTVEEFAGIIREAVWAREKVLIPSFAVGRTQLLVSLLHDLIDSGRVPRFPVYVDSPMAQQTIELYRKYASQLDADARRDTHKGEFPLDFADLRVCGSKDDSCRLNAPDGASVIIAGSGMATGGRILHHFRHNIWRRDCRVVIVGYQAQGTLGRLLVQGVKKVRIYGEPMVVRAKIHTLGGLSAHAGQTDLLRWADQFKPAPGGAWPRFVLNHGEDGPRRALRDKLAARGAQVEVPSWGCTIKVGG